MLTLPRFAPLALALFCALAHAGAQERSANEPLVAALQELLPLLQGRADGVLRVRALERRGAGERETADIALGRAASGAWSLEVRIDGRRAHLHVDAERGSALEVGREGRVITSLAGGPGALAFDALLDRAAERWGALQRAVALLRAATPKGTLSLLRTFAALEPRAGEARAWALDFGGVRYALRLDAQRDWIREIAREDGALRFELCREVLAPYDPPSSERVQRVERAELEGTLERAVLRAAELMAELDRPIELAEAVRSQGSGELRIAHGRRTLLLGGDAHEMGRAHGELLAREVRANVDATLGLVGLVYTVERERWFLAEIRDAWKRLEPHVAPRFLAELDGIADGAGLSRDDVRLANVFPELFHCSGFALFGDATANGEMLHGRVLDYMTEIGLQRNAVLLVQAPENALAFANVGYAGFLGSVTGCNERGLSIGEMGGRGEGDWDGEPMAFLLRRALEEAPDLDAALQIYKRARRTCEYFYVLAHGPTRRAAGLAAWPSRLEILAPGVAHELLPHAVPDSVLLSAGGRYEELFRRVRAGHGTFDVESALRLMDPGVAMKSNLHNALFALERDELRISHAGGPYHAFTLTPLFAAARALSLH